jgi:hypothetical protein
VLVYEAKDSDARKGVTAGMLVEQEITWSQELEARYQARLIELQGLLMGMEIAGPQENARALADLVPGMPPDSKGKEHWRCRMKDGKPLYCSIGTIRGNCNGS